MIHFSFLSIKMCLQYLTLKCSKDKNSNTLAQFKETCSVCKKVNFE